MKGSLEIIQYYSEILQLKILSPKTMELMVGLSFGVQAPSLGLCQLTHIQACLSSTLPGLGKHQTSMLGGSLRKANVDYFVGLFKLPKFVCTGKKKINLCIELI